MPAPWSRSGLIAGAACARLLMPDAALAQVRATDRLGEVRFGVSCPADASARFDRAVALLHHMTYSAAQAEFAAIASDHPTCALAHWGVAMTLFQPLWPTRPSEDDLRRGWESVQRARAVADVPERERMYIAAAAAFFDPALSDYWQRIGAWADATRTLYESYPTDVEAAAFFALSRLAVAQVSRDLSENATAAAVLAGVLRDHPTHPGAVHYTIHANDAVGREHESLDVVQSYNDIAPRNAHALHMPTHIFVRLGKWNEVIEGNRNAAAAALEQPAGDRGQWVWDEFPHAVEYLVYALLQIGDDAAALREMTRLQQTEDLQPGFKTAFHLSSIPARYALERRDWAAAASLEPRPHPSLAWDRFPWPEAVTWFARGLGAIRTGDVEAGRTAEARLRTLAEAADRLGETLWARQTEVLRLSVSAWLAHADGAADEAIRLMEEAVRLEEATPKHPVTPAPTLPAAEQLGDLLLALDRPSAALAAYRASLGSAPGRFNSIVGVARAARASGDTALATRSYEELRTLAVPGSPRPELREADAYLARR